MNIIIISIHERTGIRDGRKKKKNEKIQELLKII